MKKIFSFFAAALLCANISAQTLNEGFEGETFPPDGWTVIDGYSGYGWKKGVKLQHNCAYIQEVAGTENWLITPQLHPDAGESLHFSACVNDYASTGELRIEVSMSGTDAGSFEVLDTYYTSQSKGDAAHRLWKTEWRDYTIDLSAYAGQPIYIGFHQAGETERINVDDVYGVSLRGTSSCENPTNIMLSNLSAHAATFTWQGSATDYQYLLIEQGEEVDWAQATTVSAMTVTLTGLYEETEYEFYVRAYCSATEQSLAPKTAFKTPCEPFDVPWLETFTRDAAGSGFTIVEPDCWTVATSGTISVVNDKTYDDEGTATTVNGQAHLQVIGGGPTSTQVFAMPSFNAVLNTLEVAFDYKTGMTTDYCGALEVGYMTNPNKASTFVSLQTLPRTLTYQHAVVELSDLPANATYIAFRFAGGTSDLGSLAMDNFVVAAIGQSGEVDPSTEDIPDAGIYALNYCEASFTWYSYNNSAFAIGLFSATSQQLIAGITVTTEECDRFAYQDGVGFSEDEDYENKYYCSTKWILNVEEEGMQRGAAWDSCVKNIGTAIAPIQGLNPGEYQVQIYALVQGESGYSMGESLATIPFTLVSKEVTNLAVAVAADKTSATLTWDAPEFGQGERLYVRVWSGETVAYDNFSTKDRPTSPLTVSVIDGKSYTAIVQVVDKNMNPMGAEVETNFTVGINTYEPTNVQAVVAGGDNVTFSWDVTTVADRYVITLFWNGEFYTTLNVSGTSKMTTMPKDGTWTWTVQAFNLGANGNYFEASNAIEGNSFTTTAPDIPEDAVVMNVWGMEAGYLDQYVSQFPAGKYGWMVMFATGEEGGTGMPMPSFLIYTVKENAISGVYNVTRGNIDLESCYINTNGTEAGCIMATDAEVRIQFVAYDDDKAAQGGYRYGYYTGQFRLVGEDGNTYVGKFMEQFCNSYNYSTAGSSIRDHKGMWDEDPDYVVPDDGGQGGGQGEGGQGEGGQGDKDALDQIEVGQGMSKVLVDGVLYIVRQGAIYTATGVRVK